jgi:hypothetical protein
LSIDWSQTPLEEFTPRTEERGSGTWVWNDNPLGEGDAQGIMRALAEGIAQAYADLLPVEVGGDGEYVEDEFYLREITDEKLYDEGRDIRLNSAFPGYVEVPVIRGGRRGYERLDSLTLADLPTVLNTFVVLEEEQGERNRVKAERKEAERKNRNRIRAKERRKLKALGEWQRQTHKRGPRTQGTRPQPYQERRIMSKPAFRFETWLERQTDRDDRVGEYARECSGQPGSRRVGAYLDNVEAAGQAHDEFREYLETIPVPGTRRKYNLSEVAGPVRGRRSSLAIVADVDELADVSSVLCLREFRWGETKDESLAIFAGEALADVYLYRLRKKKLVPDNFRPVSLPDDRLAQAIFYERLDVPDLAFCRCDTADRFQKAYNKIEKDVGGRKGYVREIMQEVDTAYRHELVRYLDDSSGYYGREWLKVEWCPAEVPKTEAGARARMAEERQCLRGGGLRPHRPRP